MEKELATGHIDELGYDGLTKEIRVTMRRTAQDAVKLGYMLKRMTEEKLWVNHYDTLDEYLLRELHIDYTLATRFIKIHTTYAESEKSLVIKEQYGEYSQGALIEMLSMTEEQREAVTPDMTVKEIRQIKKKEQSVATAQHPASWFLEKFIEICPKWSEELMQVIGDKQKSYSELGKLVQMEASPLGYRGLNTDQIDVTFYNYHKGIDLKIKINKTYCQTHMTYVLFTGELIAYMERTGRRAKVIAEGEYREIDKKPAASEDTENKPKESTVQEVLPEGPLSAHGLTKTVYPPDSLIATEGCGHKYDCYSCSMECGIRQKKRYCVEAPLGNPFPCTVMDTRTIELGLNVGNMCQFVNHELAMHRAGDGEPVPCCKSCNNAECSYRCERAVFNNEEEAIRTAAIREVLNGDMEKKHYTQGYTQTKLRFLHDYKDSYIHVCVGDKKYYIDVMDQLDTLLIYENKGTEKSPLLSEHILYTWSMSQFCILLSKYVSQQTEKSIVKPVQMNPPEKETTRQDITPYSVYLEEQGKLIKAQSNGTDTAFVEKQKLIVRALQDMMESEPIAAPQPVLPSFTSEEHIKRWLSEYQDWGMWYRDEHIDVNYYKFDFADGSRLIVTEYPNRKNHPYNKYLSSGQTEAFYRLLQSAEAGHDYQYQERTSAEREIIEHVRRITRTE